MECTVCRQEFTGRADAKFCSDKCRKYASRVSELSREELYDAIGAYPKDTWKDSPEYQELLKRIETMTKEQLTAGGYSVPARKVNEGKVQAVEKKKWGSK